MQRYLTKSRSTGLFIATINPGITQTGPSLTGTHSLTRHATFLRGIQHKLRTPFDSITPKLQMLNPLATLPFCWTLNFHWRQRFNVGHKDYGKEKVDGRAGDCANQEEGDKRESTEIWIVMTTTHFPECRENEKGCLGFWFLFVSTFGVWRTEEGGTWRTGRKRRTLAAFSLWSSNKQKGDASTSNKNDTLFLINLSLPLFPFPLFLIYALSFFLWLLSLFSPHIDPAKSMHNKITLQPTFHHQRIIIQLFNLLKLLNSYHFFPCSSFTD